jgi:hypothetical protein
MAKSFFSCGGAAWRSSSKSTRGGHKRVRGLHRITSRSRSVRIGFRGETLVRCGARYRGTMPAAGAVVKGIAGPIRCYRKRLEAARRDLAGRRATRRRGTVRSGEPIRGKGMPELRCDSRFSLFVGGRPRTACESHLGRAAQPKKFRPRPSRIASLIRCLP